MDQVNVQGQWTRHSYVFSNFAFVARRLHSLQQVIEFVLRSIRTGAPYIVFRSWKPD
jgi:hypothetical protein